MTDASSKSGSTGEHLPRRQAAVDAPLLAVPRVRPGRRSRGGHAVRATVLPPDHERHRIHGDLEPPADGRRAHPGATRARSTTGAAGCSSRTCPTFAVKIRPADLPDDRRDEVVGRLAALLRTDPAEINSTIDGNPGSAFDLVRVAQDVDKRTAQLISEAGFDLPGVDVAVEARRQYTDGPLMSQILGYTGPVSAEQLPDLRDKGYQPDDLLGKAGLEAEYETAFRGTYGSERVARDATGRRTQVLQTVKEAVPGASLTLTIDSATQKRGRRRRSGGHGQDRHDPWRRDRHEPADGRDPRDGQPADVRQQQVRAGDQSRPNTRSCFRTRTSRFSTTPSRRITRRVRRTSS